MAKVTTGRYGELIITPDDFIRNAVKHGEGHFKCKRCRDGGWIWNYADASSTYGYEPNGKPVMAAFAERCPDCNGGHTQKVNQVKSRSEIPELFKEARYTDFKWEYYTSHEKNPGDLMKMKTICDSFILDYKREWEKKGIGLYIWSSTKGTGKTFLASCICNEIMEKYETIAKFVPASELVSMSKGGNDESLDAYERDPIKFLCVVPLLILDDLGQNDTKNGWLTDILYRVFDARMQKKLCTVITANMPVEKLTLKDAIVERLNSTTQPIPLPECAIRKQEAYKEKYELLKNVGVIKGNENNT